MKNVNRVQCISAYGQIIFTLCQQQFLVIHVYGQRKSLSHIGYRLYPSAYTHCIYLQVKAATGEEISATDLGGAQLHCRSVSLLQLLPPSLPFQNFFFLWWGVSLYLVYFLFTVETKINKDLKFHSFVILMKWFYMDLILQNVFQHSLYFHTQVLGCYQIHSLK